MALEAYTLSELIELFKMLHTNRDERSDFLVIAVCLSQANNTKFVILRGNGRDLYITSPHVRKLGDRNELPWKCRRSLLIVPGSAEEQQKHHVAE